VGLSILLVDDEPAIASSLGPALEAQGWKVGVTTTAAATLAAVEHTEFDVILLDLGLPDADGAEIIAKLKQMSDAMIVILSARHLEADKVRALDDGADDYVNKPFGLDELMARIRAAARRKATGASHADRFVSSELVVDFAKREVRVMAEEVKLSPKEFALLEVLCRHAGQVVTHRQMMIAGWNDPNTEGQYLRTYVAMLRQKIEFDAAEPKLILTEPGIGYRLGVSPS
jgi:two-component system KDP operon response regulator KdpE